MFDMADEKHPDLPVPTWKPTRQATSHRVPLSRDVIVDTALRLLDADGLEGVSMRRVAEELGTGAASLYAHVANKDELLDLLLDRVVGEIEIPAPDPARWKEQTFDLMKQAHRVYTAHRDIASVSLANIPTGVNSLRFADGLLAVLLGGGVPPAIAGWALDRFALYVAADAYEGSLYENRQQASGLSREEFITRYMAGVAEFYQNLPKNQFPTLTAHVGSLMGGDGDARFDFGLEMLIRSLATYVPEA
jgi:AcrR family transcriptional regulator